MAIRPWLSIVGIGDDGLEGLSNLARALIEHAQVLIGGKRHLAMLPVDGRERLAWPGSLQTLIAEIETRRGQRVCLLATGDPMHYGIGVALAKRIARDEMTIVPAPSAFSLACARLAWPLAEVETLTLHGRPLALLRAFLQPGARLLLLSHDGATPGQVATLLVECGFGGSRIVVLEHMGGRKERVIDTTARAWQASPSADFNTIAIRCAADSNAVWLPRTPGLPDDMFQSDGQLTKREVRAAALARLKPVTGQTLWDVGTGVASVAIEWLRAAPCSRAIGIERNARRIALAMANAAALGTPQLELLRGIAPQALGDLPVPDAVFIGGGVSGEGVLESCWEALKPGGRLVANAVTIEGEAKLFAWQRRCGGELSRIAVSRAEPVGDYLGWRALMPVTQYAVSKP